MSERPTQKEILRALLLAADQPLAIQRMEDILAEDGPVTKLEIRGQLNELRDELDGSAMELNEVASGFRLQLRREFAPWISRLWEEKAPKYSRAFLETLALICYRQPITRGEIEEIRGVSLSGGILRTMMERGWVREVGHREAPGRPALLATTREFLDDFNLRSIEDLPPLAELADPEKLEEALAKMAPAESGEEEVLVDEEVSTMASDTGDAEGDAEPAADGQESVAGPPPSETDSAEVTHPSGKSESQAAGQGMGESSQSSSDESREVQEEGAVDEPPTEALADPVAEAVEVPPGDVRDEPALDGDSEPR